MSGQKSPFGRALASVRAGRGMTALDLALDLGLTANTVSAIETGRRRIDGVLISHIDARLSLSLDERRRLAAGMFATAAAGYGVLYDLSITPDDCDDAHVAAGLLTVFCDDIPATAWSEIAAIVNREIGDGAAEVRGAA